MYELNGDSVPSPLNGVKILYGKEGLYDWLKLRDIRQSHYYGTVAISGALGLDRYRIYSYIKSYGHKSINAVHPTSNVLNDVILGDGCQILANSTICTQSTIGDCSIINTSSTVDNECSISQGVHIGLG